MIQQAGVTFGHTADFRSVRTAARRGLRLALFAVACGLALAAPLCRAQLLPCTNGLQDATQDQWGVPIDAFTDANGVEHGVGQVFRAENTGLLDEVIVVLADPVGAPHIQPRLDLYLAAGPVNARFRKWLPVTTSVPGPPGYAFPFPQPYTFAVSGVSVTAGQYYALVVTGTNATPANPLQVYCQTTGNLYPSGRSFTTTNILPGVPSGPNISKQLFSPARDLAFQACVIPTSGVTCHTNGRVWEDLSPPNICNLSPSVYPVERMHHAMAYDRANQVVVMFGGYYGNFSNELADTWYWDGASWTQDTNPSHPSARAAHDMAWDPVRGAVVLYGGTANFKGTFDDMWEWNGPGAGWNKISLPASPGKRAHHSMTCDDSRGLVVLVGGRDAAAVNQSDVWEWDGTLWTLAPGALPTPRSGVALAYHPMYSLGGGILTFGGVGNSVLNETLAWCPTWFKRPAGPSARFGTALALDSIGEVAVMFGGVNKSIRYDETWLWDDQGPGAANGWRQVVPSPSPGKRYAHAMAFDEARDEFVLFGGQTPPPWVCGINKYNSRETWVAPRCFLDFDGDWVPNTANDLLAFQNAMASGDLCADCNFDGTIDLFDLLCFQQLQQTGCP